MGISKNNSFGKATSMDPLTRNCMENNVKEDKSSNRTSEVLVSKEFQSKGECFRIMLMNIADDDKKTHLTKVYPMLIPVPHIIYKHHHEFLLALLVL